MLREVTQVFKIWYTVVVCWWLVAGANDYHLMDIIHIYVSLLLAIYGHWNPCISQSHVSHESRSYTEKDGNDTGIVCLLDVRQVLNQYGWSPSSSSTSSYIVTYLHHLTVPSAGRPREPCGLEHFSPCVLLTPLQPTYLFHFHFIFHFPNSNHTT